MTTKLREQRATTWDKMTEIIETPVDKRTAEQNQAYARMETEYDELTAEIDRQEKHEKRAAENNRVDRTGVVPVNRGSLDDAEPDERLQAVFNSFLRNGVNGLNSDDRVLMQGRFQPMNAAGVGTSSAGGYLVPPEFRDQIIETMKWYGPMLDLAEVITTDSGANLPWATNDDTANVGAILAENTQASEQDVTLGQASLDAYMYSSKLVRVSYQLLQDSGINFETWLTRKLGERLGRILNQHFTTGTGTAQPDGIVTSATTGVTGTGSLASTGGFSYANLIDLVESLDPAYGGGEGLRWMMHQTVRKALRKLTDAQNRPLWEPSLQTGQADSLLGYPVSINNDMATVATSSKSLLFGNIRQAYVIRLVTGVNLLRLEERFADFLQRAFLGFQRADGTMQNANAVRVMVTTSSA